MEDKIVSIIAIVFVLVTLTSTIVYGITELYINSPENYVYCNPNGECEELGQAEKEYLQMLDNIENGEN